MSNVQSNTEVSSMQLNPNNIINNNGCGSTINGGNRNKKGKLYEKKTKFNVKAQRFNYNTEATPGPGHYSETKGAKNNWNKKTFNILFAEL